MPENRQYDRVKEITDQLEAGIQNLFNSEQYRMWLNTMSKFHDYSLNNTLLIAFQKPDATLVAGYTAWQKQFGRQVQKGEKAIRILAPTPYKQKVEMDKIDPVTQRPVLDPDGNPVREETEVKRIGFKVTSVFDVSQTQGRELPTLGVDELSGDVQDFDLFFEALKRSCPVPMEFEDIEGGAKGYYHQVEQRIALQKDMSQIQTIKTAIHEMTHQKLHAIDPDKIVSDMPKLTRNGKEVEAESVAYTVCQHFGIDTSDYSFAYVAGWSHGKETPELKASLMTIRKAASELIDDIEDHVRELHKEREAVVSVDEKAVTVDLIHDNPDFSPEQVAYMEEMSAKGYDLQKFWVGGQPMDLTEKPLSPEEIAHIRYQVDVDAIPKMLFTGEQWRQIQSGIQQELNVRMYADPAYTSEQMDMIKRALITESHGYITMDDVMKIADPAHSPEEMKTMLREIRKESMQKILGEKEAEMPTGLQESGKYRYYSTQRPIGPGTYPKETGGPAEIVNFDQRQSVDNGKAMAWGYLEYDHPLTKDQMDSYELRPAEAERKATKDQVKQSEKPDLRPERGADAPKKQPPKKKSVLADLHEKQAQIAGTKAANKMQSQAKEELR